MKKIWIQNLTVLFIFLCPFFSSGQDTLIFKTHKKAKLLDTAIIKVLLMEELKEVVYVPYKDFSFNARDSLRISKGQYVRKRRMLSQHVKDIIDLRYNEQQKHIVFFNKGYSERRKKQVDYFRKRNIVSGTIGVIGSSFKRGGYWNRFDSTSNLENIPAICVAHPSIERLFGKGAFGLKLTPLVIGINESFFGSGFGFRAYPLQQLPASFFLGFDFLFANNTQYRDIISTATTTNTHTRIWHSIRENKNELFFTPAIFGFAFTAKNNFYYSIDGGLGMQILLSSKERSYYNQPYTYRGSPAYGQLRFAMGRKY